ncbi:bacterial translation initiation factor 2 (bIF-2) [[Leptolyngbya] sp. PCC 7376]|uniref:translation initiation factor IF-2 n=1 Tax=[Leptolyngbya] sp. PCC 7376 TaxID=111781 RepID=UPI00029EEEAD|nr:translation initiation factor IF-2 [[Leptolyngbya] sp. PCC 7376]AFY40150.1 bacterial translation initiation factor 2 (bIF-2) [[Leptolyngbya] sp. PCC 7376]
MNNGKVRIYELSKELNLENKDILEICENLSIAAKSHSSTITEAEAEQIRANATTATPKVANKPKPQRPKKKKQEILAVQSSPKSTQSAPADNVASAPSPSNDSPQSTGRKLERPRLQSPPNRGSKTTAPKAVQKIVSAPTSAPTETNAAEVAEQEPAKTPAKQNVVKPKLVSPPSRPSKKTASKPATSNSRPDGKQQVAKKADGNAKPSKGGPQLRPKPQIVGTVSRNAKKPKEAEPELETISADSEAGDDAASTETLLAPPKRPQPKPKKSLGTKPSSSKRKKWEEEEEEQRAAQKNKNSKLKRRPVVIDDDDDELETALGSEKEATPVSLSIARPPRPKKTTASKPPTSKPRKPSTKKGGGSNSSSQQKNQKRDRPEVQAPPEEITLTETMTLREMAEALHISETDIIRRLFTKGIAINITQTLDYDTAQMVAEEFEVTVNAPEETSEATKSTEMLDVDDLDNLQNRPPVVTIMGHVDHGKTTLLDSIRETKVVQGEAGGITQHIGAYHVDVEHNGKPSQIVFLDTPGHEAFTAMRARGARVTDIAVLVVAADDGVRPQTLEAIKHAQAAQVPIVVAINKMDKATAEPDRVKQELSEQGLLPEEWGGETIMVPVSALTGENLDTLLEMLQLVSEIEELSANPDRLAKGTVIEAHLDRARGPVASLLIQNGTLRVGDVIVAGSVMGKIRAMIDDRGDHVEAATPSFAVEILGLNEVPAAGDEFDVYSGEKEARAIAEQRAEGNRQTRLQQAMSSRRVSLSSLSAQAEEGELKELNLILKADVQGSVEAILGSLQQLPQDEVQIRVLLSAPGEISETDVDLAAASGAVIIGFNTTLAPGARQAAEQEGVDIREYNVIYRFLEEIQGAMEGLLDPEEVEEHLGKAEVRAVFPVGRGSVAGCYVQSGKVVRNRMVRVNRGSVVVYEGPLDSLKRVKEDVREVNSGYECGIGVDKFSTWKEGDIIEAFEMVFKQRTLAGRKS